MEETRLRSRVTTTLRDLLPADWTVTWDGTGKRRAGPSSDTPGRRPVDDGVLHAIDGALELGPAGRTTRFLVRWHLGSRHGDAVREAQLLAQTAGGSLAVVAPYLPVNARAALEAAGISYIDATGWVYLRSDSTGLLIRAEGAPRPPRGTIGSPEVQRLSGPQSSRVVEKLLALPPERVDGLGVRGLAEEAQVSPGMVTKVLASLSRAGAVERSAQGKVQAVHKRALLDRWTQDYRPDTSHRGVRHLLAPRGVDRLVGDLSGRPDVVLTGSAAARRYLDLGTLPVVPLVRVAAYTQDLAALVAELGLVETAPHTSNCTLIDPIDPLLMERAMTVDNSRVTGPGRALADMTGLPGRESALADQVQEQLAAHDSSWAS